MGCSFSFALVLCVLCRDVVVGCGGQLRSVCCRLQLNVVVQATKAALDNWLTLGNEELEFALHVFHLLDYL